MLEKSCGKFLTPLFDLPMRVSIHAPRTWEMPTIGNTARGNTKTVGCSREGSPTQKEKGQMFSSYGEPTFTTACFVNSWRIYQHSQELHKFKLDKIPAWRSRTEHTLSSLAKKPFTTDPCWEKANQTSSMEWHEVHQPHSATPAGTVAGHHTTVFVVCVHARVCMHVCVHTCACMSVCMCVRTSTCTSAYVCTFLLLFWSEELFCF